MSENDIPLIGFWKGLKNDVLITFQKNGTMSINSEDIEILGTYALSKNEILIKLNINGINQIIKIKYKFQNDNTIYLQHGGDEEIFIRDAFA